MVEVDRALIRTNLSDELLVEGLLRRPWRTLACLRVIRQGVAAVEAAWARANSLNVAMLPYNRDVLALMGDAHRAGRPVHLISTSDPDLLHRIAAHLGGVAGCPGLAVGAGREGAQLPDWPVRRFGARAFEHVSGSRAAGPLWRQAGRVVTVGLGRRSRREVDRLGREQSVAVLHLSAGARGLARLRPWLQLFRPRQWGAEVVLLITLVVFAPTPTPPASVWILVAGYWCLGLAGRVVGGVFAVSRHREAADPPGGPVNPFADGRLNPRTGLLSCLLLVVVGGLMLAGFDWRVGLLATLHGLLCGIPSFTTRRVRGLAATWGLARMAVAILAGYLAAGTLSS